MKILFNATSKNRSTNEYIAGLFNAAKLLNMDVMIYHGQCPFADLLFNLGPDDLFIGNSSTVTNTLKKYNTKKVFILDKENINLDFNIDLAIEVFIKTDYQDKKIVQLPAVDPIHINGVPKPHFKCQIGYVGNMTDEKRDLIEKYIVRYFDPAADMNIKIFGGNTWMGWNEFFRGPILENEVKDFYASCKLCPHFDTHISSRPFKILAARGLCVTTNDSGLADILPVEVVDENTMPWFIHQPIDKIISEEKLNENMVFIGHNHTYSNRLDEILKCLE